MKCLKGHTYELKMLLFFRLILLGLKIPRHSISQHGRYRGRKVQLFKTIKIKSQSAIASTLSILYGFELLYICSQVCASQKEKKDKKEKEAWCFLFCLPLHQSSKNCVLYFFLGTFELQGISLDFFFFRISFMNCSSLVIVRPCTLSCIAT